MNAEEALASLAGLFGAGDIAYDTGSHYSCGEANIIAKALLAGGHRDEALTWLEGHGEGDEDPAEYETDDVHGKGTDMIAYVAKLQEELKHE